MFPAHHFRCQSIATAINKTYLMNHTKMESTIHIHMLNAKKTIFISKPRKTMIDEHNFGKWYAKKCSSSMGIGVFARFILDGNSSQLYLRLCIVRGCRCRQSSTAALPPKIVDPPKPSRAIALKLILSSF